MLKASQLQFLQELNAKKPSSRNTDSTPSRSVMSAVIPNLSLRSQKQLKAQDKTPQHQGRRKKLNSTREKTPQPQNEKQKREKNTVAKRSIHVKVLKDQTPTTSRNKGLQGAEVQRNGSQLSFNHVKLNKAIGSLFNQKYPMLSKTPRIKCQGPSKIRIKAKSSRAELKQENINTPVVQLQPPKQNLAIHLDFETPSLDQIVSSEIQTPRFNKLSSYQTNQQERSIQQQQQSLNNQYNFTLNNTRKESVPQPEPLQPQVSTPSHKNNNNQSSLTDTQPSFSKNPTFADILQDIQAESFEDRVTEKNYSSQSSDSQQFNTTSNCLQMGNTFQRLLETQGQSKFHFNKLEYSQLYQTLLQELQSRGSTQSQLLFEMTNLKKELVDTKQLLNDTLQQMSFQQADQKENQPHLGNLDQKSQKSMSGFQKLPKPRIVGGLPSKFIKVPSFKKGTAIEKQLSLKSAFEKFIQSRK